MGSKARVWIWVYVSLPFELQLPPWSSSVSVTGFCNSHCPDIYQGHIKCSLCLWSVVIKTLFYQIHGGQAAPFRRWAVVASEFSVRTKKKKKMCFEEPDKDSTCNEGDLGSIPGLGRSPGEGKGYPLQYSGLENSMDCIVHGVAKSRTQLSDFHFQRTRQVQKKWTSCQRLYTESLLIYEAVDTQLALFAP